MDKQVWEGVQSLLDNYAAIGIDDYVLLLYTSDSAEPAAWVSASLCARKVPMARVWMQRLSDDGFENRLSAAMPKSADVVGRVIVITLERETLSHQRTITKALAPFDKSRYAIFRVINAGADLFASAMRASARDLSARNTTILERCLTATRLRIKSSGGTDLRITLNNNLFRWVSNRGSAAPGGTVVLPAGEVATFPDTVEGVLVADFAFNCNVITDIDARLDTYPVTIHLEGRQAVRWECTDPVVKAFVDNCFRREGVRNVGELGFGTNFAVNKGIMMNSHINERRPGTHLGFGMHNQDPGVVGYDTNLHLDLITRGGQVWIDDDPHPLDLQNIIPSANPHPVSPRDEDAFTPEENGLEEADCCGVLTCDGLKLAESREEFIAMV